MAEEKQVWKVGRDCELRIEASTKASLTFKVLIGDCEVFGAEMVQNKVYTVRAGLKIALFTYSGCEVEVVGKPEVAYISTDTPMVSYLNAHSVLQGYRTDAKAKDAAARPGDAIACGPRVMVVGSVDSGKSTLSRILANYAAREGSHVVLVDLDVSTGAGSIPGVITALPVARPLLFHEGLLAYSPLCFHYGHWSPAENDVLFKALVGRVAQSVTEKCKVDDDARFSGCIINTQDMSRDILMHVCNEFNVDVVFVLDNERLYNELLTELKKADKPNVAVIKMTKSGGVVSRDSDARELERMQQIREYFYGTVDEPLNPYSFDIPFDVLRFYKIGAPPVPESCLPIGATPPQHQTKLVPLAPSHELRHVVMSISAAEKDAEKAPGSKALIDNCVLGFVVIKTVDLDRRMVSVLSPAPHPLPRTTLLTSSFVYLDMG